MKYIDIIIPTRNRLSKLVRCLDSIPQDFKPVKLNVIIIVDGDHLTAMNLIRPPNGLITKVIYLAEHKGSVYCRNLVTQSCEDALIYATDDITFNPGAIEAAVKAMKTVFPNEDGVIGFNQINASSFSPAGVGLVGQPFLKRYPNRKLFFPEYFHFSCQEIERLGKKLDKLHLAGDARIIHYHPASNLKERDNTHSEARAYRHTDKEISSNRRANNLIWGDNNGS